MDAVLGSASSDASAAGPARASAYLAVVSALEEATAERPAVLVLDDLHWVDPSTLELLGLLMGQGFQQSVLSVLTFRPDFTTPWRVLVTRRRWLSTG